MHYVCDMLEQRWNGEIIFCLEAKFDSLEDICQPWAWQKALVKIAGNGVLEQNDACRTEQFNKSTDVSNVHNQPELDHIARNNKINVQNKVEKE